MKSNALRAWPRRETTMAAALMAFAGIAGAQESHVQLFGSINASLVHQSNQATGSGSRMSSGPWSASTFGLRGTEDLGGGMHASFRFESGWDLTQGLAGATVAGASKFWDRAAWVSLDNTMFSLTGGRQLHAGVDRIVETLDVFYANANKTVLFPLVPNATNAFGGFDTRVGNAVKLRAKLPANATVGVSYGFSSATSGKSVSVDAGWQTKEFGLGAYAIDYNHPTAQMHQRVWGLGGNYLLGPVRLYVHYMNARHDRPTGIRQSDGVWSLGAAYSISPAVTLRAAYYRDSGKDVGGVAGMAGKRDSFALMGDYALSKRTSINAGVFHGGLSGAFKTDPVSLALLGLVDLQAKPPVISGSSSTGFAVGISHRF
ncbi:porin [Comamonas badia]|uniref:porin n=1 Tax=Comamonas badia TaxID=265291 RepID=UPI00040457F6|nr:porin [Comamonas badia]